MAGRPFADLGHLSAALFTPTFPAFWYNVAMKTKTISVDKEQLTRIVEALIFSACTEACADWTPEDERAMFDLARDLQDQYGETPSVSRVYIFEEDVYEQEHTASAGEHFEIQFKG